MTTARIVPVVTRDTELNLILRKAFERLERTGRAPDLEPFVCYGATFSVPLSSLKDASHALFVTPPEPEPPSPKVVIHASNMVPREDTHPNLYAALVPGSDWSPGQCAAFWRLFTVTQRLSPWPKVRARCAAGLGGVLPWLVENTPVEALLASCERAALLVELGDDDALVLELDRALDLLDAETLTASAELRVTLSLVAIFQHARAMRVTGWPYTYEQLRLALRGLDVAEMVGTGVDRARLLHALADSLVHGHQPEHVGEEEKAILARRFGSLDAASVAVIAWTRALAEGGDVESARFGLATVRVRRGELSDAFALLAPPPEADLHARRDHARRALTLMREEGLVASPRIHFVCRTLERDLLHRQVEQHLGRVGLEYLELLLHELAELGAGREVEALVNAVESQPWVLQAAVWREKERAIAAGQRRDEKVVALPLGVTESPAKRVERICAEVSAEVLTSLRGELLLATRAVARRRGTHATFFITLCCPEFLRAAVLEDPVVRKLLRELESSVRLHLPGVAVETVLRVQGTALRPGDLGLVARALTHANAAQALKATGLEPSPPVDVMAERALRDVRLRALAS